MVTPVFAPIQHSAQRPGFGMTGAPAVRVSGFGVTGNRVSTVWPLVCQNRAKEVIVVLPLDIGRMVSMIRDMRR